MFEDKEILNEFVVESTEHLADIEHQLLTIESAGADMDVDLVNTVFRAVHSIKGAAGFLGLNNINKLAHSLENVLNLMRERQLVPTSEIVDVMLQAADALTGLLQDVSGSADADVSHHISALDAIAAGEPPSGDAATSEAVGNEVDPQTDDSIESHDGTSPGSSESVQPPVDVESVSTTEPMAAEIGGTSTPPKASATQPAEAEQATVPSSSRSGPASSSAKSSSESSIRVPIETVDHLMNLAGEMVLGRNQLLQTISTGEQAGLDAVAARINQVTAELQDAIMQTRMQPIGNVFNRFTRVVRDLSNKLGKQCRLDIEGKDVEVDKTIIEAIGDPLTHLVRNLVDHGMNTPDVRVAQGKPAQGLIQLRALHQSGKVRIEIRDDGAGIDAEKLKRKAIEKGLLTPEAAREMNHREALRLIFHPGFSTADQLSDVSGRGVGMDVVRTNIEQIGGTVDVDSKVGVGTQIYITLPLTLAIIPSLIVQSDGDRYAVPQVNIAELVRVRPSERASRIARVKSAEVLRLRGSLLPLVRLRDALSLGRSNPDTADPSESQPPRDSDRDAQSISPSDPQETAACQDEAVNIIVVDAGQQRYGLVVDELFESEEIVVKPLGRRLKDCPTLSGATILGDGRVALILDVTGIAIHSELRSVPDVNRNEAAESLTEPGSAESHSLLLFTNHPEERFAVSMGAVARIERIRADQIDSVGGM